MRNSVNALTVEVSADEYNEKNKTGKSYIFYTGPFSSQAEATKNRLRDEKAYVDENQIKMSLVKSENDFKESWNSMALNIGEEEIDEVVIMMHGTYYGLIIDDALNEDNTAYLDGRTPENLTVSSDHRLTTDASATYIGDLLSKNINTLRICSCNAGLLDAINISMDRKAAQLSGYSGTYHIEGNVAQAFLTNNNVRKVIAHDGSVTFDDDGLPRISHDESHYLNYLEELKDVRKITPYRFEGSMSEFGWKYIGANKLDAIFKHGVMPCGEVVYSDDNKATYEYKTYEYVYTVFGVSTYIVTKSVEVNLQTNEQIVVYN